MGVGGANNSAAPMQSYFKAKNLVGRFKNSQIDLTSGKIVRKAGFKFGDCDLYFVIGDNKFSKIKDKSIVLQQRIVKDNKTVGFVTKFMGKTMKLSVENLVSLSNIFKAEGFTVAVRDAEVIKKDSNGNKVKTTVKKPYLVGIGGTKLLDLPVLDITSKENNNNTTKDVGKADKPVNITKKDESTENSSDSVIDTSINMVKYTGELPLFDFMDYLNKLGCALVFVDSPKKAISKEVSDFYGLEVTLPNLVCKESFDILLRYQRIGIVNLPDKSKVLVHKPVERFIFKGFKAFSDVTIVCSAASSGSLSKLFDTTKANKLDVKVAAVIKGLLGSKFKLGKEMCYFNVDISEMKFGSKNGIAFQDMDDNSTSKMIYDYLEAYIKRDMINGIWTDSGVRDKQNIHPMYLNKSKEALDLLRTKGVNLESGIVGKPTSLKPKTNILSIRDKDFPFKFRMTKYTGYINSAKFRMETTKAFNIDNEKVVDEIVNHVSEKMDYEITELGECENYAYGMSNSDQFTYCFYGAHREAAYTCLGYIFDGSRNMPLLNNYFRKKLNTYTETANSTYLRILDSFYKSGQNLTDHKRRRVLFLGTLFKRIGKSTKTGLYLAQPKRVTQFMEDGHVTLGSSIFLSKSLEDAREYIETDYYTL